MMHKHTKPAGQRKVSPPGPSYMNGDQIGKAVLGFFELRPESPPESRGYDNFREMNAAELMRFQ